MRLTIDFLNSKGSYEIWNSDSLLCCYVVPRNAISSQLIQSIEKDIRGNNFVYFLMDTNESKNQKRKFYIGETTALYNRMASHKSNRKWWNQIVVFGGEDRKVDESCINALERLLIEKYQESGNFDLDNSEGSQARIKDDYKNKLDYILMILDYLGYGCETEIEEHITEKEIESSLKLEDEIDKSIRKISSEISSDQLKLYKAYYLNQNNDIKNGLCAIWPKNSGKWFEAELYFNSKNALEKFPFLYDISSRARGNRKTAMKISKKDDIKGLVCVINEIIKPKQTIKKRERFTFSMLGLKAGDELVYIRDTKIKCYVNDDSTVIFNGKVMSITSLATDLIKPKNKISGSLFFMYKGERLDMLRTRLELEKNKEK